MSAERSPLGRAGLDSEYELIRELGHGGSAVVYLARKRSTGEEVAIKLIRAAYLEDQEALARFAREARFASRLSHSNVVPIREVLPLGDGGVALVMAHVTGHTLKQVIRDSGPLAAERAERILRDVAAGLGAAHAMEIVHRDVKPENIFVDETGRGLLADFGLARSTTGDVQLTMTGVAIGTPTYMPPEQIDEGVVDARGDIYSLGLVAWEMLAGKRPWDGDSLYALLYHQKHDQLPDVRELRPDVSDRLGGVIMTAIEKDPNARWQSVAELVAALDGALPVRNTQLHTPVGSDTIRISRADVGALLAGTAAGAPASGLGASARTAPVAPPLSLDELEAIVAADRPRNRFMLPTAVVGGALLLLFGGYALHQALPSSPPRRQPALAASTTSSGEIARPAQQGGTSGTSGTAATESAAMSDSTHARALRDSVRLATARADSSALAIASATLASKDTRRAEALVPVAPAGAAGVAAATTSRKPNAASVPTRTPTPTAPVAPAAPVPSPTASASRATIVVGGMHTCLIAAGGRGFCWGANTRGQLGSNAATRASAPTPIVGGLELTAIAAGLSHTCALARGAGVWCWGENDRGQLGDRSNTMRPTPVHVAEGHSFRVVAAGASHSCALDTDGHAWCWGAGNQGQLGNGTTRDSNVPVAASNVRFRTIAAGWNFTCGLDVDGRALCWGENDAGQLGTRDTVDRAQPTPVVADFAFVAIAAGHAHACGLTAQGDAYCWGRNSSGQLGDGTTTSRLTPVRVKGDAHFTSITAGAVHTCASDGDGQAFCWGQDTYGQLGDGGGGNQLQPARVAGGHAFASLHAFGSHTCGATASGDAFCWGYNLEGQLGDGSRVNRARPTYLEPPAAK